MPARAGIALILPAPWLLSGLKSTDVCHLGQIPALVQAVLFAALLLAAAWIDYQEHIIPDILNLGIALSALLCFRPANLWGLLDCGGRKPGPWLHFCLPAFWQLTFFHREKVCFLRENVNHL